MSMIRLFLLSLVLNGLAGAIVPYNDPARISAQRYQFSSEDRLMGESTAIPEWPYFGRIFKTNSHGRCEVHFSTAGDGYDPYGNLNDSSVTWFKKTPIQFSDVCAFSRLIAANDVIYKVDELSPPSANTAAIIYASTANNYLRQLAPVNLQFVASTHKQQVLIKCVRSCWSDLFYIGFELGVVRAAQNLKMVSTLNAAQALAFSGAYDNTKSTNSNQPLRVYPDGLQSVFNGLLLEKNLDADLNDEVVSVGDTKFFINMPLKVDGINAASLALYLSIPAPQHYNNAKVVQAFVGEPYNGLSLGVSMGFVWNSTPLLNLHFFSYAQYSLQSVVSRRVPRLLTRTVSSDPIPLIGGNEGADAAATPDVSLSGGPIKYAPYSTFSTPDSYINELADQVRSINIRRGPEFGIQIGNVFEHVLVKNLQLDVSYRFKFKANDVLGPSNFDFDFYRDQIASNSFMMSHVASGVLNYAYTESTGFLAGFSYTIAGRSALKETRGYVGFSGVF